MSKLKKDIKVIDGLPSIGAVIGVGYGIYKRKGWFMTLFLGTAFAGVGYLISEKLNN